MTDKAATSYYEVLEVSSNASSEEIDAAYQRLTSYLDPGSLAVYSMVEDDEVSTVRDLVDEAYHTLSDPDRRAAYDNRLWGDGAPYPSLMVPEPHPGTSVTLGSFDEGSDSAPGSARRASPSSQRDAADPARGDEAYSDDDWGATPPAASAESAGAPESAADAGEISRAHPPVGSGLDRGAAPVESAGREAPRDEDTAEAAPPRASEPPRTSEPSRASEPPQASEPLSASELVQAPERREVSEPSPASESPRARVRAASQRPRRLWPTRELPDLNSGIEVSGALLKGLRESAGASLEDVAEMTKISKRYLRALEEHDFELLPAPVYVRGFVAEYARILGLDPHQFASSYMGLYRRYRGEGG